MNTNDNFSDFLTEYNNKSQEKINWINEKIKIITDVLEEIKLICGDPALQDEISLIINILKKEDLDILQKTLLSLKEINRLTNLENFGNTLTLLSLRTVVSTYIEIAKITSNEQIATFTISLMKILIKKMDLNQLNTI